MDNTNSTPSIDNLEDIGFWSSINKGATISDQPFIRSKSQYQMTQEQKDKLVIQCIEEGYFESPMFIEKAETENLRNMISNLYHHKIMPLYIAVYDEFWEFLYRLRQVATPLLGDNYRLLPDFWAWYIEPGDDSTGWKPHRDAQLVKGIIRADGRPKICTIWVPLMDVDTSNSCIYVLPRKYDDEFKRMVEGRSNNTNSSPKNRFPLNSLNLNRIRALPVKEGAFIGWDSTVFHWGSGSSRWATEPRISIGIYVESEDLPIHNWAFDESGIKHINLDDPEYRLPFKTRLTIIACILETYIYKFNNAAESDKFLTDAVRQFHGKWKWTG